MLFDDAFLISEYYFMFCYGRLFKTINIFFVLYLIAFFWEVSKCPLSVYLRFTGCFKLKNKITDEQLCVKICVYVTLYVWRALN